MSEYKVMIEKVKHMHTSYEGGSMNRNTPRRFPTASDEVRGIFEAFLGKNISPTYKIGEP